MNSVMSNIFKYISKYRLYVVLSIACAAVYALLSLYIPILTGDAVDVIITKGDVDFDKIFEILLKDLLVILFAALAQWIMGVCNNKISYNVIRDLRRDAFEKIQTLPLSYIDSHAHGDIVSRIISDVDTFSDGLLLGFSQLFTGVVTILATVFFMLSISWKVGLLVIALTPLSLIAASVVAKLIYKMFRRQSEIKGRQTSYINEMIGNVRTVKAYGRESDVTKDFKEINDELTDVSTKAIFYSAITNPLTRFINSLVYASVALYGAFNVIALNITVGNLTSILMYANQYTKPFNEISSVITELQNAFACAERVFELINRKERVPEKEDAVELTNVSGNVEFKNVSFSYNKETKLIENFNINIKPGMRVAIVGPTGCGKTTVINLLMRFYDTDKGGIYVDGIDTRDITRNSLRRNFGMVLQETWLRSGTVRDNIAMGREDATEEEIIAASKAAHAHSFIKKLEKGYDTVISEDGGSLSAGQKQLICIARLFLALPPMLILDEATSSIDTRTELKIQNAFAKLMKGRTSFIVAHRLSTIKEADLILVMNKGNIVETGSDEELTQKKGFYYNLKTAVEK